ncbi:hypothetical protein E2562_027724 [Oryza meyeriana var. granulata]|uniref:Disease resistance R13L4/SHOC-2-like LRR domain-containing protein n=1 Tax=Oryza meyeriana var. granulata TaxID=110450 RepID=A0A6G1CTI3_9ORYZ|nr:hypothetical protein E2562_027724 [Oryza meyeriana var. granulata]
MPNWIEQLTHLVKFYLSGSKLKEGKTMVILGALPNLMLLCLSLDAYLGKNLVFRTGAFPNLRTLWIHKLEQLREIRFEDGSSPLLEKIGIRYCRLETGIVGIIYLTRLKEITLGYKVKVGWLGQLAREVGTHPNSPVLRMEEDRSYHDLGGHAEVEATMPLPEPERESSQVTTLTLNNSQDLSTTLPGS